MCLVVIVLSSYPTNTKKLMEIETQMTTPIQNSSCHCAIPALSPNNVFFFYPLYILSQTRKHHKGNK